MARKDIFSTLKEKYSVRSAMEIITGLFESKIVRYYAGSWSTEESIESTIDKNIWFSQWKHRQSCISCSHMRKVLFIDRIKNSTEIEDITFCLEYYINMYKLFLKNLPLLDLGTLSDNFTILQENINTLIGYLNHHTVNDNGKYLIVPKNPQGTSAAEVSSKQTGIAILKYHHALLKGNLDEKRKLLNEIALEYELILKKPPTSNPVFEKTRGLLNNLHIRHNNQEGKQAKNLPDNLEEWYDELYQMLLLCILENDNIPRMEKAKGLMDSINTKG